MAARAGHPGRAAGVFCNARAGASAQERAGEGHLGAANRGSHAVARVLVSPWLGPLPLPLPYPRTIGGGQGAASELRRVNTAERADRAETVAHPPCTLLCPATSAAVSPEPARAPAPTMRARAGRDPRSAIVSTVSPSWARAGALSFSRHETQTKNPPQRNVQVLQFDSLTLRSRRRRFSYQGLYLPSGRAPRGERSTPERDF